VQLCPSCFMAVLGICTSNQPHASLKVMTTELFFRIAQSLSMYVHDNKLLTFIPQSLRSLRLRSLKLVAILYYFFCWPLVFVECGASSSRRAATSLKEL
jgi:hypothetical protein